MLLFNTKYHLIFAVKSIRNLYFGWAIPLNSLALSVIIVFGVVKVVMISLNITETMVSAFLFITGWII